MERSGIVILNFDFMNKEDQILKGLETLTGRFDGLEGRFDKLERKVDAGFAASEEKFDFLAHRLFAVEEKVDKCATSDRVNVLEGKMIHMFDQQGVILQRLDQERFFTYERIKRVEDDVSTIKHQLKIA